jgi:hypothetical protein
MTHIDDDPVAFVEAMDRCWLERRYADLAGFLADDVVMVAQGGHYRLSGSAAALASYRDFMERSRIEAFTPVDYRITRNNGSAVVEYAWRMVWESEGVPNVAEGREVLVLAEREKSWQVIWRMQLSP